MNTPAHFIIVDDEADEATDECSPFYGPYPTRHLAEAALENHPRVTHLHVTGLGRLARHIDPFVMHANSGGV